MILMYDFFSDQCSKIFVENISAMLSCFWVLNWSNQQTFFIWSKRWESVIDVNYTIWSENFIKWSTSYLIHESWLQSTEFFAWLLRYYIVCELVTHIDSSTSEKYSHYLNINTTLITHLSGIFWQMIASIY